LHSLTAQTLQDFDVIVVDQNDDDRLVAVVDEYRTALSIKHLFVEPRGKASANNEGLALAKGEVVAFPDDDCWYPADLLRNVARLLDSNLRWAAVTGREASDEESATNTRFDLHAGEIDLYNIWRRHISFTMFFRRAAMSGLLFNVELGVGAGTKWGAGEDTDFLLRFMRGGHEVFYDPALVVCHPDWGRGPFTEAYYRKAHSYAMGMGRLLRTHEFPVQIVLKYIVRPAGGMILSALKGSPGAARYYQAVLTGRLTGWMQGAADAQ
jgi:glycosyltransferase involved in cell wall biosynthesis